MGDKKVDWIIPIPTKGAGGFRTILQNALSLVERGYTSTLYLIPNSSEFIDADGVKKNIDEWFSVSCLDVKVAGDVLYDSDVIIATSWDTAEYVYAQPCKNKLYFVQDYEPWFFPLGDEYICAEQSYHYDLSIIALGEWLASKVSKESRSSVYSCAFGADLSIYKKLDGVKQEKAICAIFQPEKSRRLSGLLVESIALFNELVPDLKVYLYGSQGQEVRLQGVDVEYVGILTPSECNELYNRCLCGISLSCTNPSRIPFEMMAAGLPVVELDRESNRIDFPSTAVKLASCNASGLVSSVREIIESKELQERMSESGIVCMQGRDLSFEGGQFCEALEKAIHKERIGVEKDVAKTGYVTARKTELLQKDRILEKYKQLKERQEKVYASCIESVLFLDNLSDWDEISVAVWSDAGQGDIIWSPLAKNQNEEYRGDIIIPSTNTPKLFHLHFYLKKGENYKFLFSFQQVFLTFTSGESTHWEKRIEKKSFSCQLASKEAEIGQQNKESFFSKYIGKILRG